MAETEKTPTKVATRVCRTCNENIVVRNHPLDLFGAKASEENIISILERFFELKIVQDDGLPSYICRSCHQKIIKFEEFFKKVAFSRHHQESVLRVKRGRKPADSPSAKTSPPTRRDIKKKRVCEDASRTGSMASRSLFKMHMDEASKTRPRPILPAPSAESEGKKRKLPTAIVSSEEPQKPSKQEEVILESGLRNPLVF